MNKTQLIDAMTTHLNSQDEDVVWGKGEVKEALEAFEAVVTEACCQGDPVTITGFVKFARVDRKARQGRNPMTGEIIQIAAKSVAKATPLKKFKDSVLASVPATSSKKAKKSKS